MNAAQLNNTPHPLRPVSAGWPHGRSWVAAIITSNHHHIFASRIAPSQGAPTHYVANDYAAKLGSIDDTSAT